jgi:hypothetical protein
MAKISRWVTLAAGCLVMVGVVAFTQQGFPMQAAAHCDFDLLKQVSSGLNYSFSLIAPAVKDRFMLNDQQVGPFLQHFVAGIPCKCPPSSSYLS